MHFLCTRKMKEIVKIQHLQHLLNEFSDCNLVHELEFVLPPSFVFPHIYWHNMTLQNTNWRPVKRSTLWLLDRSINNTRSKLGIDRRRCQSLSFYQTKYIIYSPAKIWITTSLHFSERWRLEVSSAIIVNTPATISGEPFLIILLSQGHTKAALGP